MPISNGSLEDEDCAVITDWTDNDKGVGVSYQATAYGKSCFCFDTNESAAPDDYAYRKKDSGSVNGLGNRVVVSFSLRLNAIGTIANIDYLQITVARSDWCLNVRIASDGFFVEAAGGFSEVGVNLPQTGVWQNWTLDVNLSAGTGSATCDIYLGNVLQASNVSCNKTGTYVDGESRLLLYGYNTDDRLVYLDYYKVGDGFSWIGKLNGVTNPAKIMGISITNISKVMGV
jgi:hypothetical protein